MCKVHLYALKWFVHHLKYRGPFLNGAYGKARIRNPEPEPETEMEMETEPEPEPEPEPKK